jgi:pimeloyl-ACP methyl ester carboxylesterase
MIEERVHRTTSKDGTNIVGRVHGQGPPLVLVHGALADGETAWTSLLPHLTDHYRCYTPSVRGRGLSDPSEDLSPARLVEDVTSFVESLGERAGLVGLSSGALLSLAAAEHSPAVRAVAAYEPPVFEVIGEETLAEFRDTIARMDEQASDGRLADAARTFIELVTNDGELAAVEDMHFIEDLAPNVPVQLREFSYFPGPGPSPTAPPALAQVEVPVLLLRGTRSSPGAWFEEGVRHVSEHVRDARIREIPGAGHLGPILQPEPVAAEVKRFFAETLMPT